MTDMNDNLKNLLQEAQKMQNKMQEAQKQLEDMEVTGESGAGLVKVTMTGRYIAKKIEIDPSIINTDEKQMLEDLVAAAVRDAVRKVESETRGKMADMTKGLNLPTDFQSPFGGNLGGGDQSGGDQSGGGQASNQ